MHGFHNWCLQLNVKVSIVSLTISLKKKTTSLVNNRHTYTWPLILGSGTLIKKWRAKQALFVLIVK